MKLIPLKQAQARLLNAMADQRIGALTLTTFKKDRSLTLRREESGWALDEQGFTNATTPLVGGPAAKRVIKEAFKREFPRSNKLYLSETDLPNLNTYRNLRPH